MVMCIFYGTVKITAGADRLFPAITHSFRTADNIDDGDPYASYYAQGENS